MSGIVRSHQAMLKMASTPSENNFVNPVCCNKSVPFWLQKPSHRATSTKHGEEDFQFSNIKFSFDHLHFKKPVFDEREEPLSCQNNQKLPNYSLIECWFQVVWKTE